MIRSYVCRQCRVQFKTAFRAPQSQPRATFISLRSTPSPEPQNEETHSEDTQAIEQGASLHNESERGKTSSLRSVQVPEGLQPGRYSRLRRENKEQYISQQMPQHANQIDLKTSSTASDSASPPTHAHSISKLLDEKDVNGAWDFFLKEYTSRNSPAFTNPSPDDIPLLRDSIVFSRLLNVATLQFCKGVVLNTKPTGIIFRFEQLGIANPKMWANAIGYATDQLLWLVSGGSRSKQTPEALLEELVALWRLFFQCRGTAKDSLESMNTDWRSIPNLQSFLHSDSRFAYRLQRYHPRVQTYPSLQFSAVTIFNLFDEVNQSILKVPKSLRERTTPFLNLLTHLLAGSNVQSALQHVYLSPPLKPIPNEFRTVLIDQINSAPYQAMKIIGSRLHPEKTSEQTATVDTVLSEDEKTANLEDFYLKRIARAILSQSNAVILQKLWEEVQVVYKKDNSINIPPVIYNAFLSGFMQLFQPDKTSEVWNFMIAHNVTPNVRTWVSLLDGCVKARDLDGLNGIWDKMIRSGVEPDNHAWTTRVYGLIALRNINIGFMAMDEMGKKWLAAQTAMQSSQVKRKTSKQTGKSPATSGAIKPSVQVVNAAISALTNIPKFRYDRKVAYVQKVLEWSARFSIAPDVVTYNSLVGMYLRGNDHATAFKLLRQMSKDGIQGDMATHTMLLNAAFNSDKFKDLSHLDQADRVIQIFNDLEADGFQLNAYICSSAIDRLLKLYGNVSAVMIVLNHMASRNITVSPQINASIVTHCFQQTPPDIVTVDNIVARIFGTAVLPTDRYLLDRIVEGYAVNQEVDKMMKVLSRMTSDGKLPGWEALTAVVRALAQAGDWDRVRAVVRDVQTGQGIAKGGVMGLQKHRGIFFGVVRNLGHDLGDFLADDSWEVPGVQDGTAEQYETGEAHMDESDHYSAVVQEGVLAPETHQLRAQTGITGGQ